MEKQKKIIIECECGAHLLHITHDYEIFESNSASNAPLVRQEFDLAMFTYGTYHKKPGLFEKICVAWNYLRTGKMHEDQIILDENEAQKLVNFISENIIKTEK